MKRLLLLLALAALTGTTLPAQKITPAGFVNPFIGTGGHGHTYPGATAPFGMMQLSPDTRLDGWDGCSGYHHSDSVIYGFSHTHLSGTGCSDYGDILLMPVTENIQTDHYQYASVFSHKKEKATAGYYQVFLEGPKVNAELTTTARCGMHRYTFSKNSAQFLVLDLKHRDKVLDSRLEIVDSCTVRGYRFSQAWAAHQRVFFEIKFSKPVVSRNTTSDNLAVTDAVLSGKDLKAVFGFKNDGRPLLVKVSISGVDLAGAHKNMLTEMEGWQFDSYRKHAAQAWDKELSKIEVRGGDRDHKTVFYTALYHSMSAPNIYNDVDGRYRGRNDKIHSTDGKFDYYTVFSLWDTHRAEHPLLTIIDPKRTSDFINTFIRQYEEGGILPVWELSANETWCMIGYHAVPVIWDAYQKGIRSYDAEKAFAAMKHSAMTNYFGLPSYRKYGYVRSDDEHESVSKTLEYAYDDWCIAQMAKALDKTEDYNYFMRRSQNWKNVFDPTTGFMRARRNGTLYEPFSPYTVDNNYTEANSWQYSFYTPHAIPELMTMLGGKEEFDRKLDDLFHAKTATEGREQADITGLIGQYAHGNEPSHHIAYLYNYTGKPEKTQAVVKYVIDSFYKNAPDGLIGNEDCGQMSAWYVLSAMGLYPVCPGNGAFELGAPAFDSVILHLDKTITLRPYPNRDGHALLRYEDSAAGKRKDYKTYAVPSDYGSYTTYDFILNGKQNHYDGELRASAKQMLEDDKNRSYTDIVPNPFIVNAKRTFKGKQQIEMSCADKDATIYYSFNNEQYTPYSHPLPVSQDVHIRFYAQHGKEKSPVQEADFTRLPDDRRVELISKYNQQYTAGGPDALVDGIHGDLNWRKGGWQGYQGQDFEGIVAFDKEKSWSSITASFLEDQRAWIFYPSEVQFYTSDNGNTWTLAGTVKTNKSGHDEKVSKDAFTLQKPLKAKYIKVIAKHFGKLPAWHEGAGNDTFIFIDEISVQ